MNQYARIYRDALLNDVVPFWEKHSLDRENGGYFTCLDREVFDKNKLGWWLGRLTLTFVMMFGQYGTMVFKYWIYLAKMVMVLLKAYRKIVSCFTNTIERRFVMS